MGIVFVDMMAYNFVHYGEGDEDIPGVDETINDGYGMDTDIDLPSLNCQPGSTGSYSGYYDNEGEAIDAYRSLRTRMKNYLYWVLIKATLGPAVALMMFISSLRFITGLAGAEVDMSALGRLV